MKSFVFKIEKNRTEFSCPIVKKTFGVFNFSHRIKILFFNDFSTDIFNGIFLFFNSLQKEKNNKWDRCTYVRYSDYFCNHYCKIILQFNYLRKGWLWCESTPILYMRICVDTHHSYDIVLSEYLQTLLCNLPQNLIKEAFWVFPRASQRYHFMFL